VSEQAVGADEESVMTDTDTNSVVEAEQAETTAPAAPETTAPETTAPETTAPAATATVATAPAATATTATATATKAQAGDSVRRERPIQTVGRRKEAIVRVRIVPGTGQFLLNRRAIENYFPSKVHQQLVREPLVITERVESLDIFANLRGGGITGQAGALRLAIARALCDLDPDLRPALKKAGFLTRDARVTESKKYGLKKARKAPQYSKR
jgi:small subunit ribosomal protein S9